MVSLFRLIKKLFGIISSLTVLVSLGLSPMVAYAQGGPAAQGLSHMQVCIPKSQSANCYAQLVTNANTGKPLATATYVNGYAPTDLHAAYNLPALPPAGSTFTGNGQTIAIVDAYDNPNADSDLLAYRRQFNLPLCATTNPTPTTSDLVGCLFTKVNQNGLASPLPAGNISWGQEIDLDVQMAASICPDCKILLVEANSNSFADLGIAVDRAALMGANTISNSYGGSEFSSEASSTYNGHYNHPGIAITVSSGDSGYGVMFPAASQYVTAVGGTSLSRNTSNTRGWSETAWSGAGSGCSAYITKPAWQPTIGSCSKRVVADVSAVADPYTGVAVYDSYGSSGGINWYVFGGTSVSAPIIAGVYALAGNVGPNGSSINYGEYPYSHTAGLFDITSGSNGRCANKHTIQNTLLCNAGVGFDGPTGLGTPNGLSAF